MSSKGRELFQTNQNNLLQSDPGSKRVHFPRKFDHIWMTSKTCQIKFYRVLAILLRNHLKLTAKFPRKSWSHQNGLLYMPIGNL